QLQTPFHFREDVLDFLAQTFRRCVATADDAFLAAIAASCKHEAAALRTAALHGHGVRKRVHHRLGGLAVHRTHVGASDRIDRLRAILVQTPALQSLYVYPVEVDEALLGERLGRA